MSSSLAFLGSAPRTDQDAPCLRLGHVIPSLWLGATAARRSTPPAPPLVPPAHSAPPPPPRPARLRPVPAALRCH
ncbi:hypothetical protein Nepgr_008379 [Nepenthes gracilis]|uniref:Uncharacterized protein n=1 Tax=Nepenthes gracilis TaxID=150966 RepID=A0AAD3XJ79_NEPGR|nr:hypothetical protein Nepgr_008379 [Nepenthes gracilis]